MKVNNIDNLALLTDKQVTQEYRKAVEHKDNGFAEILAKEMNFRKDRKEAAHIARQLQYSKEVIDNVKSATNIGEVNRAMMAGRHSMAN